MAGYNPAQPYGQYGPGQAQAPPPQPPGGSHQNRGNQQYNYDYSAAQSNQAAFTNNNNPYQSNYSQMGGPPMPPFNGQAITMGPPQHFPQWPVQTNSPQPYPQFYPPPPPPPPSSQSQPSHAFNSGSFANNHPHNGTASQPSSFFPFPGGPPLSHAPNGAAQQLPPFNQILQTGPPPVASGVRSYQPGTPFVNDPSNRSAPVPPKPAQKAMAPSEDGELSEGEYQSPRQIQRTPKDGELQNKGRAKEAERAKQAEKVMEAEKAKKAAVGKGQNGTRASAFADPQSFRVPTPSQRGGGRRSRVHESPRPGDDYYRPPREPDYGARRDQDRRTSYGGNFADDGYSKAVSPRSRPTTPRIPAGAIHGNQSRRGSAQMSRQNSGHGHFDYQPVSRPSSRQDFHRQIEPTSRFSSRQSSRQTSRQSSRQNSRQVSPARPSQSVPAVLLEAEKQAQNAALNLLPHGVKFADFVDEGIDGRVVEKVFHEIGAPVTGNKNNRRNDGVAMRGSSAMKPPPTPKTAMSRAAVKIPVAKEVSPSPTAPSVPMFQGGTSTTLPLKETTSASTNTKPTSALTEAPKSKGEERKDVIARRLAEAKSKRAAAPAATVPSTQVMKTAQVGTKPSKGPQPVKTVLANPSKAPAVSAPQPNESQGTKSTEIRHQPELSDVKPAHAVAPPEVKTKKPSGSTKLDKDLLLKKKMAALLESRKQTALGQTTQAAPEPYSNPSSFSVANTNQLWSTYAPQTSLPSFGFASQQQPAQPDSAPAIPGLFLASQNASSFAPPFNSSAVVVNQRKRPVASDFDSPEQSVTLPQPKKPFGYGVRDNVRIDVSDDEDEDEDEDDADAMDVDPGFGDRDASASVFSAPSRSLRDVPPLSDFPHGRSVLSPFVRNEATSFASPSLRSPVVGPEDLKKKETAIEEMKRKIAEAEQRKKGKGSSAASQLSTSNATPSHYNTEPALPVPVQSIEIDRLMEEASRKIQEDREKLVVAQVLQEDLKRSEAESAQKLQTKPTINGHRADTGTPTKRQRLAAEMERIEADLQEKMRAKQLLAEEIAKLGQEFDDELDSQTAKLEQLTRDGHVGQDSVSESAATVHNNAPVPADKEVQGSTMTSPPALQMGDRPKEVSAPSSIFATPTQFMDSSNVVAQSEGESGATDVVSEMVAGPRDPVFPGLKTDTPMLDSPEMSSKSDSAEVANTAYVNANSPEDKTDSSDRAVSDSSAAMDLDERQGSSGPASRDLTTQSERSSTGTSDEGLVSSSDPAVADHVQQTEDNSEAMDVDSDSSDSSEEVPQPASQSLTVESSPGPQAMDLPAASAVISNVQDQPSALPQDAQAAAAHLTGETQQRDSSVDATKSKYFTPYDSPLKQFHAYRFHRDFTKEVPGGYRSLTYTNNLDAESELCRFELAGGVCNDMTCMLQHFRDIIPADSVILSDLGSPSGLAEQDRLRFITGLKAVLNEMRAKKIRDFDEIAKRIVAFRQDNRGDKSKVLLLD